MSYEQAHHLLQSLPEVLEFIKKVHDIEVEMRKTCLGFRLPELCSYVPPASITSGMVIPHNTGRDNDYTLLLFQIVSGIEILKIETFTDTRLFTEVPGGFCGIKGLLTDESNKIVLALKGESLNYVNLNDVVYPYQPVGQLRELKYSYKDNLYELVVKLTPETRLSYPRFTYASDSETSASRALIQLQKLIIAAERSLEVDNVAKQEIEIKIELEDGIYTGGQLVEQMAGYRVDGEKVRKIGLKTMEIEWREGELATWSEGRLSTVSEPVWIVSPRGFSFMV